MDNSTFNGIIEEQMDASGRILIQKAQEYATDDRLHNFKNAAVLQSTTLRGALAGMMAKHTVSVYDMCNTDIDYSDELWNEKITDHINYLLLLRAVVAEEKKVMAQHYQERPNVDDILDRAYEAEEREISQRVQPTDEQLIKTIFNPPLKDVM